MKNRLRNGIIVSVCISSFGMGFSTSISSASTHKLTVSQRRAQKRVAWHRRTAERMARRESQLASSSPLTTVAIAKRVTVEEPIKQGEPELRFENKNAEAWSAAVCPKVGPEGGPEIVVQAFPKIVGTPAAEEISRSTNFRIVEVSVLGGTPDKELYAKVGVRLKEAECEEVPTLPTVLHEQGPPLNVLECWEESGKQVCKKI